MLVNEALPSEDYERRTRTEEGRFTETRQKLFSCAATATSVATDPIRLPIGPAQSRGLSFMANRF